MTLMERITDLTAALVKIRDHPTRNAVAAVAEMKRIAADVLKDLGRE